MLPLGVALGPKMKHFNLDSYLAPFFDELEQLQDGVPAYDADTESYFTLKAFVCLVTGDTPVISKLFRLSGHNSAYPCHACKISSTPYLNRYVIQSGVNRGEAGEMTHGYYPLSLPTRFPVEVSTNKRAEISQLPSYEPIHNNLPLRSHDDYLRDGHMTHSADPKIDHTYGIKGVSPFAHLPTISFPASCLFDPMHLLYLNFVLDLCALFNGSFFKDKTLNRHNARLPEDVWAALGEDMAKIGSPTSWGRPPRDIAKYIGSFKVEDLNNFLTYYMLPLIYNRVQVATFRELRRFVVLTMMATSIQVQLTDIALMETQLPLFLKWFYNTFYQNDHNCLPICKYTEHCLVHIVQDVQNWGSTTLYWQFPEVLFSLPSVD